MRILIALVSLADTVPIEFCRSVLQLNRGDHEVEIFWAMHTITSAARNVAAHKAVKDGFDRLLFLDTDMTFDPGTLVRLASHDVPIVSGLYRSRRQDAAPYFAFNFDKIDIPRMIPEIDMRGPALFKLEGVPTGCLMIKTDVFRQLDEYAVANGRPTGGQPYFHYSPFVVATQEMERMMCEAAEGTDVVDWDIMRFKPGFGRGEDLEFCLSCKRAGIPIHVDTRLIAGHLTMRSMGTPMLFPDDLNHA